MKEPCSLNDINGFSSGGRCCCSCEYQRPITAHPWNKDPFTKGSVRTVIGYGCACPEFFPNITFSDREHSLCECWTENTWREELEKLELKLNQEHVWDILTRP